MYECDFCSREFDTKKGVSVHETKVHSGDGKPWHDEQRLRRLYLEEELSQAEIGERWGVSQRRVGVWLNEFNIPTRGPAGTTAVDDRLKDEEWVRQEYCEKLRSPTELAELLDCSKQSVIDWIEKHGFPTGLTAIADPRLADAELMHRLYVEKELSAEKIASRFNCSGNAVFNSLRRHEIETRDCRPDPEYSELHDRWNLWEWYWGKDMTTGEIADKVGCTPSRVIRIMKSLDVPRRSKSEASPTGPEHHNWREYSAGEYYGKSWASKREAALERDNYTCQFCGISNLASGAVYGRGLSVHHVTPFGAYDSPDQAHRLNNLISLCHHCHTGIERSLYD